MDKTRHRPLDIDTHNALVGLAATVGKLMASVSSLRAAVLCLNDAAPITPQSAAFEAARSGARSRLQKSSSLGVQAYDELLGLMEGLARDG